MANIAKALNILVSIALIFAPMELALAGVPGHHQEQASVAASKTMPMMHMHGHEAPETQLGDGQDCEKDDCKACTFCSPALMSSVGLEPRTVPVAFAGLLQPSYHLFSPVEIRPPRFLQG